MVTFRCSEKKKQGTLQFSGDLTINELSDMVPTYQEALTSATSIKLEFKDIGNVDMAFLQSIHALHKSTEQAKKPMNIQRPLPENMRQALQLAGLTHYSFWNE